MKGAITSKVIVQFYGEIRHVVGRKQIEVDAPKEIELAVLINKLDACTGGKLKDLLATSNSGQPQIRILINGQDHFVMEGMGTKVRVGDTVVILPAIGGG